MLLRDHPEKLTAYVGATGRTLRFSLVDADGDAIDLTDYTVQISAKLGSTYKITRSSCVIEDAAGGEVSYAPASDEIDAAGEYTAQLRLIAAGGLVDYTEPFIIDVQQPVDDAGS